MYFSIIKKIAIVLFLIASPISALAAGLGSVNISSALGEPLDASIELLSITPSELASLKAKIDSEAAYSEQGLTRLAIHDGIKVNISKSAGNNILKLTSNSSINEPVLDLLVVVEWSNGRVSRQYTLLLDPPTYQREANQAQTSVTKQLDNTAIKKAAPDATSNTQTSTSTTSVQEHLTKNGDTLYKIARRMQPAEVSLDKVLVALFEANPDAFDGKNINRLKVGKILQAPSQQALNEMTSKYASNEIKLQTADWNQYRNRLAEAVAQKNAQASDEDMQSTSGKIKSAAEDQSGSTGATKDVVKLSTSDTENKSTDTQAKLAALQEEISAREKGLKEAEDRTAALEKQIEDMQKLLALKNNTMLNAQKQVSKNEVTNEVEGKQEASQSSGDAVIKIEPEATKPATTATDSQKPEVAPKTVVVTEEIQPSFFASLLDSVSAQLKYLNKAILAAVIAIVALLIAVWLYLRNKRSKKLNDFEQGIMTSGNLKASTVFGDTSSGMIATGDTSFLTDFSHSASNALIDTNDVDPIAEAEVYMAYGRDAQAEEILKDAISKEPQRYELQVKLLEMYASNKNTAAFETIAGEMFTALGVDHPTWIKVAEIGAKLEPGNPLYQSKHGVAAESAELKQHAPKQPETNLTGADVIRTGFTSDEPVETEDFGLSTSEDTLDASDFSDSPLAAEVDLDFSIADSNNADSNNIVSLDNSSAEVQDDAIQTTLDKNDSTLQFDLSVSDELQEVAKASEDVPSLDFPEFELKKPVEEIASATSQAIEDASPEMPKELSLDMPAADETEIEEITQEDNKEESSEDIDFGGDIDINQNTLEAKPANILDVSGISLDIDDELSFVTDSTDEQANDVEIDSEEPMTPVHEEVETKLELVAAYIDMEDKDGAKELLEEVLKEGNTSQRERANEILASLA